MFTGIIEEKGTLLAKEIRGISGSLRIGATTVLEGTEIGDSIAVNGVCLTVTTMGDHFFTADVMAETLRTSSLGELKAGDFVNLERAMPANGRFGGHMVSGHIDGKGTIVDMTAEGNATWIYITAESKILQRVMERGSIAIDGISLTVAQVSPDSFAVSVIPHTADKTTLLDKRTGDRVNLENDLVGKYVQNFLKVAGVLPGEEEQKEKDGLTLDMLQAYLG